MSQSTQPDQPDATGEPSGGRRRSVRRPLNHLGASIRRRWRSIAPLLVVAIVLAGFGAVFANQAARGAFMHTAASADATASPAADAPTATSAAVGQPTKTSAPTKSHPTATPIGGVDASAFPTPVIFHVETVTVTPDPSDNFTHTCADAVYEPATLTVTVAPNSPGETVNYDWLDSLYNDSQEHTGTLVFAPGETSKSVKFQEGFSAGVGDGSPQQFTVGVTYSDSWYWPTPQYHEEPVAFTCVRQITDLTLTPSVSSVACSGVTNVTMTWTLTASPGPRMYVAFGRVQTMGFATWWAPGGFGAIVPTTTGPGDANQVSGTLQDAVGADAPNGSYWMQVTTTSPNSLTAKATITKAC